MRDQMTQMVSKLCGMAEKRVIISFAPDTWYYTLLKGVSKQQQHTATVATLALFQVISDVNAREFVAADAAVVNSLQ
jgi:Magnesium-protoporphyrin IX methyltransferase C-terminus